MIRFFSRIREKLLSENRFTRYMFYALGEIILVVIGILIALSINNWNEDRKNHQEEIQLVRNFVEDLNLDLVDFQDASDELDSQLSVVDRVIGPMLDNDQALSYESIGLIRYSSDFRPITQRNHYQSVSNLENEYVREKLQAYFLVEDQVLDMFREYEEIIHEHVRPYLRDVGMHNLESLYEQDPNSIAGVLLHTDVLDEQILVQKFQQLMFERRLKTDAFKIFISELMAENQALSESLLSWIEEEGKE